MVQDRGKKDTILKSGEAMVTYAPKGSVNIYEKAGSKKLGTAKLGDTFEVKGKSGKYTKVSYDGGVAYIYTSYLTGAGSSSGSSETITPVADKKAYIDYDTKKVKNVNVRQKASSASSSTILGTLKRGDEITITGTTSRWTRIKYGGGEAAPRPASPAPAWAGPPTATPSPCRARPATGGRWITRAKPPTSTRTM